MGLPILLCVGRGEGGAEEGGQPPLPPHNDNQDVRSSVSYYRLRISECLALKWSDLDWLKGALKIERSIVEQHLDDVKTEDSRRSLTVASDLMQRLQSWKTVTMFGRDSDWMFASPVKLGRQPYSYTGVWRELQRAADAAGIGKLGTHSFRHTHRAWLDAVRHSGCRPTEDDAALGYQNHHEHLQRRGD